MEKMDLHVKGQFTDKFYVKDMRVIWIQWSYLDVILHLSNPAAAIGFLKTDGYRRPFQCRRRGEMAAVGR
jgi:hypothetical protein